MSEKSSDGEYCNRCAQAIHNCTCFTKAELISAENVTVNPRKEFAEMHKACDGQVVLIGFLKNGEDLDLKIAFPTTDPVRVAYMRGAIVAALSGSGDG